MQLTRVDVYNITLGKIKIGKRVNALTDETARKYMLPQLYDLVLASLLERHPWSFATVERKLGKTGDGAPEKVVGVMPSAAYRYGWVYPDDCHKLLMVGRVAETEGGAVLDFHRLFPWDVMSGESKGRVIKTWHDHACARYLSNAIPEAMWPASFVNALTWALASEITRAANASDSDADYRMKQAQAAFEAAKLADVRDNGDGYRIPGDWVLSRRLYCGWGVN